MCWKLSRCDVKKGTLFLSLSLCLFCLLLNMLEVKKDRKKVNKASVLAAPSASLVAANRGLILRPLTQPVLLCAQTM